jgi:hypothetical protein
MFPAICPLTNSNLGIEVFLFEILDFEARRPFKSLSPVQLSLLLCTSMSSYWHLRRCTALIFCRFFTTLSDTLTLRSCLIHLNQSFLRGWDTSAFQLFFSSQASLKILFPSAIVGEAIPNRSYIFPRWLTKDFDHQFVLSLIPGQTQNLRGIWCSFAFQ